MDHDRSTPMEVLTRQEYKEAIVIRVLLSKLPGGDESIAVRDALHKETEVAARPLILDLAAVEFLSSAVLGWLITVRKKLMQRGQSFRPPCRRRGLFAFFPDQAAAMEAIRQGEDEWIDSILMTTESPIGPSFGVTTPAVSSKLPAAVECS